MSECKLSDRVYQLENEVRKLKEENEELTEHILALDNRLDELDCENQDLEDEKEHYLEELEKVKTVMLKHGIDCERSIYYREK